MQSSDSGPVASRPMSSGSTTMEKPKLVARHACMICVCVYVIHVHKHLPSPHSYGPKACRNAICETTKIFELECM
jgi:hypothetical protein